MKEEDTGLEAFNHLIRRVEITRDARFQANLRLEVRQKLSHFMISILSLFVILISLIPNIFDLSEKESQALLALTIINSVFVIITTFLDASGNFVHKGEYLHRSARRIAPVFSKLISLKPTERTDPETIHKLQKKYQDALDDCPFNHDNLDYNLIKISKPHLFKDIDEKHYLYPAAKFYRVIKYNLFQFFWLIPHFCVILFSVVVIAFIVEWI